jgi:hypothetical protein
MPGRSSLESSFIQTCNDSNPLRSACSNCYCGGHGQLQLAEAAGYANCAELQEALALQQVSFNFACALSRS